MTVATSPSGPTPPGAYTLTYVEKTDGCSYSWPETFTVTAPSYNCSCVTYVRDVLAAQGYDLPGGPEYADGYTQQFMASAGWKLVNPANGTIPSDGLPMVMVFSAGAKDADSVAGHMALVANSWAVHAGLAYSGQDPSYNGTSWNITVLHVDWPEGRCSPAQTTFTGTAPINWSNLSGVNFYIPNGGSAG